MGGGVNKSRLPKILAICLSGLLLCTAIASVVFIAIRDDNVQANPAWMTATTGTEADPFILTTAVHMSEFATQVNTGNTFHNQFIRLGNNIALSGQWVPIGNAINLPFRGNFNGNHYTISGLLMSGNTTLNGLFGQLFDGAVIRNLIIQNPNITSISAVGGQHFGALAARVGTGNITIDRVFVMGAPGHYIQTPNNTSNNHRIGGLIGEINGGTNILIRNVRIGAETRIRSRHTNINGINHTVGGLVGLNNGTLEIRNSEFLGRVYTIGNGAQGIGGSSTHLYPGPGQAGSGGSLGILNIGGFIGSANNTTQVHNSLSIGIISSAGNGGQGGTGGTFSGTSMNGAGGTGGVGGNAGTRHVGGFVGLGSVAIEIHNSITSGQITVSGQGGRGGTGGNSTGLGRGGNGGLGGHGGTHNMGCSVGRIDGGSLTVAATINNAVRDININAMRGLAGFAGSSSPELTPRPGNPGSIGPLPVVNNNTVLGSGTPVTITPGTPQGHVGVLGLFTITLRTETPGTEPHSISFPNIDQEFFFNLTNIIPEPPGFELLGWGTSFEGTVVYLPNASHIVTANRTLYAVWKILGSGAIHFNFTGGILLKPPQLYTLAVPTTLALPTIHYMNNVWEHRNHEDFVDRTFHGWYDRPPHQVGRVRITHIPNDSEGVINVWALWLPTI